MRMGEWGGLAWDGACPRPSSAWRRPRLLLVSAAKSMARTAFSCTSAPQAASAALPSAGRLALILMVIAIAQYVPAGQMGPNLAATPGKGPLPARGTCKPQLAPASACSHSVEGRAASSEGLTLRPLLGREEAWISVGLDRWEEWPPCDLEAGDT